MVVLSRKAAVPCIIGLIVLSEISHHYADATWSIAATDTATMQVGGAGASCVPGGSIEKALYRPVPGKAVLVTQAYALSEDHVAVTTALSLLRTDSSPSDVLDFMNGLDHGSTVSGDPAYPDYTFRQNAIADLDGEAAAHTGVSLGDAYEAAGFPGTEITHRTNTLDTFTYSVQGNIVSNGTVASALSGFGGLLSELGSGCDLADRLMIAMEAVPLTDNGDVRCMNEHGTPASGAFLRVDAADGTPLLDIDIVGDGTVDPTAALRDEYDAWRASNSCGGSGASADSAGVPADGSASDSTARSGAGNLAFHALVTFVPSMVASFIVLAA